MLLLAAVPFAAAAAFAAGDNSFDDVRGDGEVRPPLLLLLFGEYFGEFLGEFDDRIVLSLLLFDGTGEADLLLFGEMERFDDIFVSLFFFVAARSCVNTCLLTLFQCELCFPIDFWSTMCIVLPP